MQHHRVIGLDAGDAGTDFDDSPRGFMAEQVRKKFVRALYGIDLVDLGAAYRRVEDFDQHLTDFESVRKFDLVYDKGLARFNKDRGLDYLDLHLTFTQRR